MFNFLKLFIKYSIEIFPSYKNNFIKNILNFNKNFLLKPYVISITFNKENLINYKIIKILTKNKIKVSPHISCLNLSIFEFKNILNIYYINNIKNLVILKGDNFNELNFYYSYNLNNFIILNFKKFFKIYNSVYLEKHPKSNNYKSDFKNYIIKINNNCKFFITQYFYNIESYYYILENINFFKKKNINIIPGILIIENIEKLISFSNICKSEIPNWFIRKFNKKIKIKKIYNEFIINLFLKFIKIKIKNIHIYTINNFKNTIYILSKIILNINV